MERSIYQIWDINVQKGGLTINWSINCELRQMWWLFRSKIDDYCRYDGVAIRYVIHCECNMFAHSAYITSEWWLKYFLFLFILTSYLINRYNFLSKYYLYILVIIYWTCFDHSLSACLSCISNMVIDLIWTEEKHLRIYINRRFLRWHM